MLLDFNVFTSSITSINFHVYFCLNGSQWIYLCFVSDLKDSVTVVGYPLGGDTISVTKGVVSRIEVWYIQLNVKFTISSMWNQSIFLVYDFSAQLLKNKF